MVLEMRYKVPKLQCYKFLSNFKFHAFLNPLLIQNYKVNKYQLLNKY